MLIVSKTRKSVNQQSGQPDEMGLDGYGCPVTEQRVVMWERLMGCGLAESCGCGLPVVPGAWCLRGCCCCCRLVVAEVEWLRNDLLLGRSRLTEMMMGTMGWVADGQTGRRCVYVQCRLSVSGQTLFLRSTGSREWEWSPLVQVKVQVQLQLQSCRTLARCQVWEGACCGRSVSVSVSVRRTWTWTPAHAATDRDLGEPGCWPAQTSTVLV